MNSLHLHNTGAFDKHAADAATSIACPGAADDWYG
jgi:hypothetical protein